MGVGRCSDVPDAPLSGPTVDRQYSSRTAMLLQWPTPGGLHGALITGFEVDYDDGLNGLYTTVRVASATARSQMISGLTAGGLFVLSDVDCYRSGRTYRTRYRVVSEVGMSLSSPVASHLAAAMPSAPSAPVYYNYTVAGTTMTVGWSWTGDNGGSAIIGWHVSSSVVLVVVIVVGRFLLVLLRTTWGTLWRCRCTRSTSHLTVCSCEMPRITLIIFIIITLM